MDKIERMVVCPFCRGNCWVPNAYEDGDDEECPECHGEGMIAEVAVTDR